MKKISREFWKACIYADTPGLIFLDYQRRKNGKKEVVDILLDKFYNGKQADKSAN